MSGYFSTVTKSTELQAPLLSIVTPAFNEAENLPLMYDRLAKTFNAIDIDWEWIVIDDHSADATFMVLQKLAEQDPRVHGLRLARNFGSHAAIDCGLTYSRGHCVAVMAADLQDPPETLPVLLAEWQQGIQVVWAVRQRRSGEKATTVGFAQLYYLLMRRVVGLKQMPATGADFFLLDRAVVETLKQFHENNVSLFALLTWMGFRQSQIFYDKQARIYGRSGWNLEKKLKLVLDSVIAFSYLPIRLMSYLGFVVALLGFLYAGIVILNSIFGQPIQGWTSLMVVTLILGGVQILMMGILGEYLWRSLDESRRRPRYWVEVSTDDRKNLKMPLKDLGTNANQEK